MITAIFLLILIALFITMYIFALQKYNLENKDNAEDVEGNKEEFKTEEKSEVEK